MSVFYHRIIKLPKALIYVLFLGSVSIIAVTVLMRNTCTKLSCLQMDRLASYKQKKIYEDTISTYRALYQRNGEILRVDVRSNIIESEAKTHIDGQLAQIKTQYADTRAPYPGEVTKTIVCEKYYQPSYRQESVNGLSMTIVESFLTDRLTYGACTDDQAVNRSILALLFCPSQKKLYQLEFIAPTNVFTQRQSNYETMLTTIQCVK